MVKSKKKIFYTALLISILSPLALTAQQINVNRINQMPDIPSPYLMRDWKEAAIGYDSLVFDSDLQGEYLPLIFFRNNGVNYPSSQSFGLHTVVGTTAPNSGEAINVIPAVISATLVGIDKSDQNGYNWVKMIREYFNNRPEENVYLNHPVAESGDDWWYATMPNVFFYQLYDLYPDTEDFDSQFRSVADQWLESVKAMNGTAAPWQVPFMNYRGWYLSRMEPHTSGVTEPEAAGAIAWLLYNAFKETGEEKYRIGAELSMEFLNGLNSNPAYELQLPYGAFIAAKMNAELGTLYDIEKIVNWCFDVGPLRSWGAVVGSWGGLDVSGLIGEVNGNNDYAFLMNTFEQTSALIPLVKYDERFANAIGKWMLNAANSTRLFYTNYLPDFKQDSEEWSHQFDPRSYIGHEALRESRLSQSPYATGDAIAGGWGETNLALYGSSHIGIFGGIIDTTDVEKILKLDLNKTDFFSEPNYPTYLIYNPYEESKEINMDIGIIPIDVYELISNSFIVKGKSGSAKVSVPAKQSVVVALIPSGAMAKYELNKMLVDGIVVDYNSGQSVSNYPPRIKALAAEKYLALKGEIVKIYCTAVDQDEDSLEYSWKVNGEVLTERESILSWRTPDIVGEYLIQCEIIDENGTGVLSEIKIEVTETINDPPEIINLKAEPRKIDLGAKTKVSCEVVDQNGDSLIYDWTVSEGSFTGIGKTIEWTAPTVEGNYIIFCKVSDASKNDEDSIIIAVRDLSIIQTGSLISFYPFSGSAEDNVGNNDGVISGAVPAPDRFGVSNSAFSFDGENDFIRVANSPSLNFQKAISINFWMKINSFFDREQYPISHGNWERRWKISISGEKLRWTIKTAEGITDLDSETILKLGNLYNVSAVYSGSEAEIYINGKLDAFKFYNGNLETTDVDLTIAQATPSENQYNFNGILDDIRIYDYALTMAEIENLYDVETSVKGEGTAEIVTKNFLFPNYPNPFNSETNITFQIAEGSKVALEIFNFLGQKISTLFNGEKAPGIYNLKWNGKTDGGRKTGSGIYFLRMRSGNYSSSAKLILLN